MVDLFDFEDGVGPTFHDEPPHVHHTAYSRAIPTPQDDGKTAGYLGIDSERGRTYLTVRARHKHLYRRKIAYAISESVLDRISRAKAAYILVWERDTKQTYEYRLKDFLAGDFVPPRFAPSNDRQRYVPTRDALARWDQPTIPMTDRMQTQYADHTHTTDP